MPEVTVSILTYNQIGPVKACLASLLRGGEEVKFILTSNGNPDIAAYFQEFSTKHPNVTVVVNATNEGFWKPNNHALTLCDTKYFCLVNDDITVPVGWLNVLKAPMVKYPRSVFSAPDSGCTALQHNFHGTFGPKEYCEGALLLCDTEILQKHGLFEPMPGLAYGEDSNASLRFRELGYNLHWVPLAYNHLRGATSRSVADVPVWQEKNHAFLRNRWSYYLTRRTFDYPIVLKRNGAMGDVLLLTPLIRELKKQRPLSKIYVETICEAVLEHNPHIERAAAHIPGMHNEMRVILDGAYESEPANHFAETYAKRMGITLESDRTEIYVPKGVREWAKTKLGEGKWIGINTGPTWASKELAAHKWVWVVAKLKEDGYKIVRFGTRIIEPLGEDLNLAGQTTVTQMAALIAECKVFICVDSLPMHVAQAVGTPIVPLFGVTLPGPILTSGSKAYPVVSDPAHPGSGLRHRMPGTTFTPTAENPMDTISAQMVYEKTKEALADE